MSFFGIEINAQLNRLMFDIRLHLAKNRYLPNLRTIYQSFVQYDPQVTGLILPFNFEKALNTNGIFMKKYDLQIFEKVFNQNGKLNWFNFLHQVKQPMGPLKRQLVERIFDSMDSNKSGKIATQQLMSHFNFNQIDSYRYGKKTEAQIRNQFISMFSLQDGSVTKQQFLDFYDDLNVNFGNTDIFLRMVSSQWFYTPQKIEQVKEEQVRTIMMALRNKLLERTQASKDEFLIRKLFDQYDRNGNSHLGDYDLDIMIKQLGLNVQSRFIPSILDKIDRNHSGFIEFDEFKKFLFHNPYSY